MILNVSGRTDIVAFYSSWFIKRLQAGFVDVRNPFYEKFVERIYFRDVDAFLFCTKNPLPLLQIYPYLEKPFLIHVTITPYQKDIEPGVIDKRKIIQAIQELSRLVGAEKIYVRYDPIFLSPKYSLDYHIRAFEKLCKQLQGSVKHYIISFLDIYKNVLRHQFTLQFQEMTLETYDLLGPAMVRISKKYGATVQTCAEGSIMHRYGFLPNDCLDEKLAQSLTGKRGFSKWKARKGKCQCVQMVDIGAYNSCQHYCQYCYANYDEKQILKRVQSHDENSSLLIGHLQKDDILRDRKVS